MTDITFITGNQDKADYLAKFLGTPVKHLKLDLDEIQSLDLEKIVEHKVRQAYEQIKSPVIVDDTSVEFTALNGLPGPFIRYFIDQMPAEQICALLDGRDRTAIAKTTYGYYDGRTLKLLTSELKGRIAETPAGTNGYGWDTIFIPEGQNVTRASLNDEEYRRFYLRSKPIEAIAEFLSKSA